jgi:hypothetical protein
MVDVSTFIGSPKRGATSCTDILEITIDTMIINADILAATIDTMKIKNLLSALNVSDEEIPGFVCSMILLGLVIFGIYWLGVHG